MEKNMINEILAELKIKIDRARQSRDDAESLMNNPRCGENERIQYAKLERYHDGSYTAYCNVRDMIKDEQELAFDLADATKLIAESDK